MAEFFTSPGVIAEILMYVSIGGIVYFGIRYIAKRKAKNDLKK